MDTLSEENELPIKLMTLTEVAAVLGIAVYTARRRNNPASASYDARFPKAYIFGKNNVRYKAADVAAYIDSCKEVVACN